MSDQVLTAGVILALFSLGAVCAVSPRAMMRYRYVPRALGLTDGARRTMTRAAGLCFMLFSLWLAWRVFLSAA